VKNKEISEQRMKESEVPSAVEIGLERVDNVVRCRKNNMNR
jgi:hypothetical protein